MTKVCRSHTKVKLPEFVDLMNRGSTLLNSPKIAPYGSWKSPITSDLIVEGTVGLSQPTFDGDDIYWMEMRPKEAGRNVIVKRNATGSSVDVNQPPLNARTRVHEYGGGDYSVSKGLVCFSNFSDQRLYRQDGPDATPQPLTALRRCIRSILTIKPLIGKV